MESISLDFQQAKLKHLQFKSRLRSILYGEIPEDENPVLSQFECPVGKWIYGHAMADYGGIPEVHELEKVHAELHTVARELVQLYKSGKVDESRRGMDKIESIADDLVSLLVKVEDSVGSSTGNSDVPDVMPAIQESVDTLNDMYTKNRNLYAKIKTQSEAFVKQQEFYKTLLEASPVVLWMADKDGTINYMSPAWYKWTGADAALPVAETWTAMMHKDDREGVVAEYLKNIADRVEMEIEFRMNLPDKTIWCLCTGQPGYNADKNFTGYAGSLTDITGLKKAEENLNRKRDEERKVLHDFFMEAPAIFAILRGPDHIYELANPLYRQLIGNRDVTGMTVREALPELEGQGFYELLDNVYNTKEKFIGTEMPITIDKGNGPEEILLTFICQAIVNDNNEAEGILVYATEVTEQVRARKVLEKSEEHFKRVADMSPQIIWTAGPDGTVDYYNERWYEFTGHDRSQTQNGFVLAVHPQDKEFSLSEWHDSVASGKDYSMEYRLKERGTNEYRWFLGKAVALKNEEGKITQWLGTNTDIQEQKNFSNELEKKVEERTRQLSEMNTDLGRTNEELSQFAYVASHDLQEPLRKIITFSNRIDDKFKPLMPAGSEEYIKKIRSSAERMSQLVADLLNFSGTVRNKDEFVQTDLNVILQDLLVDFEEELRGKNAVFESDPLPVIPAIPLQITQLFHNLLSNSLKFSKTGIQPLITIRTRELLIADNLINRLPDKHVQYVPDHFQR